MEILKLIMCITGHSPKGLPWGYHEKLYICKCFKQDMREFFENAIKNNYKHFIVGVAMGIDMICAEIIIELKKVYKDVVLECAIPCLNQHKVWTWHYRRRYKRILRKCDIKTIISEEYTETCMNDRNKYMVDKADYVLAVWNGNPSGTSNTIKYARKKGKKIRVIDPYYYFE